MPKAKIDSDTAYFEALATGLESALKGTRKADLTRAFDALEALSRGVGTTSNVTLAYGLPRRVLTPAAMQSLVVAHYGHKRWDAYVGDLYAALFRTLFSDIDPASIAEWDYLPIDVDAEAEAEAAASG